MRARKRQEPIPYYVRTLHPAFQYDPDDIVTATSGPSQHAKSGRNERESTRVTTRASRSPNQKTRQRNW